jgi:hypothetical protein
MEPPKMIADPSSSLEELGYHLLEVIRTRLGLSKMSQVPVSQGVNIRIACKPLLLPYFEV